MPARTVCRVLRRHGVPYLRERDPMTGEFVRSSKATANRYGDRPGELVGSSAAKKKAQMGYDYVHSMVDDRSRLAYSEILPDENGATCTGFIARAADYFVAHGILAIERVMTDNHWSYRRSVDVAAVIAKLGAKHKLVKPHCPWQNGKVEQFNRTLQAEWAYRHVFTSNAERAAALASWLESHNLADATARSAASHRSAACNWRSRRTRRQRC